MENHSERGTFDIDTHNIIGIDGLMCLFHYMPETSPEGRMGEDGSYKGFSKLMKKMTT